MTAFTYDRTSPDAEYYEILSSLMERWEYEIVEFKEAKGQYSEDKIGQYFSAISNEANLKNQQYGWFVLGVSEQKDKYPEIVEAEITDSELRNIECSGDRSGYFIYCSNKKFIPQIL